MTIDTKIFSKSPLTAELGKHNNNNVIWVSFPKEDNLILKFKTLKGAHWSNTEKKWYVRDVQPWLVLSPTTF